jgi:hypothetical protein
MIALYFFAVELVLPLLSLALELGIARLERLKLHLQVLDVLL